MDRLFGRSKAKQPPPSLTDCISSVSIVYTKCQYVISTSNYFFSSDLSLSVALPAGMWKQK